MKRLLVHLPWLGLLLLALSGCATTESENMSERPWSTPQNWETGFPGGLYDQQR